MKTTEFPGFPVRRSFGKNLLQLFVICTAFVVIRVVYPTVPALLNILLIRRFDAVFNSSRMPITICSSVPVHWETVLACVGIQILPPCLGIPLIKGCSYYCLRVLI